MAERIHLSIDQGTHWSYSKTIYNTAGEPVSNVTSNTFKCQIRKTPLSSVSVSANAVGIDPGMVKISLVPGDTECLTPGRYCYDVIMISNTNIITRVFEGIITLNPAVTSY